MKAITLWQPWASLIALEEKRYETRSWPTRYRGPLAIHAAAPRGPGFQRSLMDNRELWRALDRHQVRRDQLPTSAIVCLVELVDCYQTAEISHNQPPRELAFGDWRYGRYAWRLKLLEVLKPPIPARGRQGLWDWAREEQPA